LAAAFAVYPLPSVAECAFAGSVVVASDAFVVDDAVSLTACGVVVVGVGVVAGFFVVVGDAFAELAFASAAHSVA